MTWKRQMWVIVTTSIIHHRMYIIILKLIILLRNINAFSICKLSFLSFPLDSSYLCINQSYENVKFSHFHWDLKVSCSSSHRYWNASFCTSLSRHSWIRKREIYYIVLFITCSISRSTWYKIKTNFEFKQICSV